MYLRKVRKYLCNSKAKLFETSKTIIFSYSFDVFKQNSDKVIIDYLGPLIATGPVERAS